MLLVILSAGIFSIHQLYKQNFIIGLGFGFLTLLTTKTAFEGFMYARFKDNFYKIKIFTNLLTLGIGIITISMLIVGTYLDSYFLIILGIIGSFFITIWIIENKRGNFYWLKEHYSGMIFSGVAAYTAFLIIGYNSFFKGNSFETGGLTLIRWFGPTILGIVAVRVLNKKLKRNQS